MVVPSDIIWKIPVLTEIEYVIKNYDPTWVANPPTLTINPLSSVTTPVPAYDDTSCSFVTPITWNMSKTVN